MWRLAPVRFVERVQACNFLVPTLLGSGRLFAQIASNSYSLSGELISAGLILLLSMNLESGHFVLSDGPSSAGIFRCGTGEFPSRHAFNAGYSRQYPSLSS